MNPFHANPQTKTKAMADLRAEMQLDHDAIEDTAAL
jgi:hypothetical protein